MKLIFFFHLHSISNSLSFYLNSYVFLLILVFIILSISWNLFFLFRRKKEKRKKKLVFKSENKKDTFCISSDKLLYLKASGNYTEIHFLSDELPKSLLLRSTLKSIEKEYQNILLRCHRSYLINPNIDATIIKKNKNIILDIGYSQIPVSQTYQDKIYRST
ncbi:MAG: LytTR family transcriptional regulator [Flavobacteriaceae bacterium]|nr:LytTR family transcriptional regulator [Flavobacteriaceae bacterium]